MKPAAILGIVLIVLGAGMLIYRTISWTETETVAKVGPLKVEAENTESIALSPILGGVMLIAGIGLAVVGFRKS